MSQKPMLASVRGQLLFFIVQAVLFAGAFMTSGVISIIFWILFAAVTIGKYVVVFRAVRGRKRT